MLVLGQIKLAFEPHILPFAVDFAMDGACRLTTVHRKHLGGAPRRSQKRQFLPHAQKGFHHGAGQRCLARSGRTPQNHHAVVRPIGQKIGEGF